MRWVTSLACAIFFITNSVSYSQEPQADAKQFVAKAQELAKAKDFAGAAAQMQQAVALEPKNDVYLAVTSDFELKARRFNEGLEHALRAIKLNDKQGAYYV